MKIRRSIKDLRITYADRHMTQQASTSNVNLRADVCVKRNPCSSMDKLFLFLYPSDLRLVDYRFLNKDSDRETETLPVIITLCTLSYLQLKKLFSQDSGSRRKRRN